MHIAWRKAAMNGEDAPSPLRGGLGGGIQTDVGPLREKPCLDWDPPPDLPRKGGGVAFYERSCTAGEGVPPRPRSADIKTGPSIGNDRPWFREPSGAMMGMHTPSFLLA